MPWVSRWTRFLDAHWVYGQEHGVSCALACTIMAAYKINKFTPGAKATFTEKEVIAAATKALKKHPLGRDGMSPGDILTVLNLPELNMPGWKLERLSANAVSDVIIDKVGLSGYGPTTDVTPVIVGVNWDGGYGHAILIDTIRPSRGGLFATVCDPWDANVHVTAIKSGQPFVYEAKKVSGVNLWGPDPFKYKGVSRGTVKQVVFWRS